MSYQRLERHVETFSADGPTGLVFVGSKGAPINGSRFHAGVWKPAKASVKGLPERLVLHDLRAWSATKAAQHGATVKELQALLGHATRAMALKYQRAEAIRHHALAAENRGEGFDRVARREGVDGVRTIRIILFTCIYTPGSPLSSKLMMRVRFSSPAPAA